MFAYIAQSVWAASHQEGHFLHKYWSFQGVFVFQCKTPKLKMVYLYFVTFILAYEVYNSFEMSP